MAARIHLCADHLRCEQHCLNRIDARGEMRPLLTWPVDLISAGPHSVFFFRLEKAHHDLRLACGGSHCETSTSNRHGGTFRNLPPNSATNHRSLRGAWSLASACWRIIHTAGRGFGRRTLQRCTHTDSSRFGAHWIHRAGGFLRPTIIRAFCLRPSTRLSSRSSITPHTRSIVLRRSTGLCHRLAR